MYDIHKLCLDLAYCKWPDPLMKKTAQTGTYISAKCTAAKAQLVSAFIEAFMHQFGVFLIQLSFLSEKNIIPSVCSVSVFLLACRSSWLSCHPSNILYVYTVLVISCWNFFVHYSY